MVFRGIPPSSKVAQQGLISRDTVPLVAVHDESGLYKRDRYFTTGFVFASQGGLSEFCDALLAVRQKEDYWREVHYNGLRGTGGKSGSKYRTAMGWFDAIEREMVSGGLRAYVLTVDSHGPNFNHRIFAKHPEWAYNRFTRMALENAVQWLFKGSDPLKIRLLTDGKTRRPGGDDLNPRAGDNFSQYLPQQAYWRIRQEATWPHVVFDPRQVEDVHPGKSHPEGEPECELVQVADLVVSAVGAAIRDPGRKRAKRRAAARAASWVRKTQRDQWVRMGPFHRKFMATLFRPGENPAWIDPVPLAVNPRISEEQEVLF